MSPGPDIRELLKLAEATALEAGQLLLARQGEARTDVSTKSTSTDMVSEVDRESEALIVSRILAARPDDAILGEEGGTREGTSGVRWVVDPLDGTTNYLYGIPAFGVSIAVEIDGAGVIGVVHDPSRGELFSAVRGEGARCNGHPLRVSSEMNLGHALVGTGFGYEADSRAVQARFLASLMPHVRDLRRSGSAALDLCWVACGRLDAYYERLAPWDRAAGEVIVREAGGLTAQMSGEAFLGRAIVAAGPGLFEAFCDLLTTTSDQFP